MHSEPETAGSGPLTRGELGLCGAAATVLGILSVAVPVIGWIALPASGVWLATALSHLPSDA